MQRIYQGLLKDQIEAIEKKATETNLAQDNRYKTALVSAKYLYEILPEEKLPTDKVSFNMDVLTKASRSLLSNTDVPSAKLYCELNIAKGYCDVLESLR